VKKPDVRMNGSPLDKPWGIDDWKVEHPSLTDMLQCARWDDQTARQTSTLLLFVEDGVLKCCLNDRHYQRSAFFTASTLADLIVKVELAITTGTVEWKARGQKGNQPGVVPW